ncbi:MAG: endonuclease III [Candidatus Omnitrophica bacterium]|nr:endonuclease III [Candidatus Omnitrophota bacterium]
MAVKKMDEKAAAKEIVRRLKKEYPAARTALKFKTPVQMLVSTILSAQCTDERVNKVTPGLFKKYKTAGDFAKADLKVFENEIRSTGFYHNKAKNIIGAAKMIVSGFGGDVPDTMEELVTLPGVARKTANVVLHNVFGKVEGVVVDTHVRRLTQRLGLADTDDPVKIEKQLMSLLPRSEWGEVSYLLIDHGRKICKARNPDHKGCVLNNICPSARLDFK